MSLGYYKEECNGKFEGKKDTVQGYVTIMT